MGSSQPVPKVLLFDLGGVLVDFAGFRDLPAVVGTALKSGARKRYLECPVVRAYETGEISSDVFAEKFIEQWDVQLMPAEFLALFRSLIQGFFPAAETMLQQLSRQYRLAALSNSNAIHWEYMESVHGVFQHFERAISSHQVGLHKPDSGIYQYALDRLNVSAGEVFFFDDTPVNVEAARKIGIQAWHTEGIGALQSKLQQLGILEATFLSDTSDHGT